MYFHCFRKKYTELLKNNLYLQRKYSYLNVKEVLLAMDTYFKT